MDRLEAMSILVAAAESGSFSAASRKLHMPLPTVSRKVAELEAHLNARLLVRSTRKLTLTDAGAAYLAACKQILEQVSEAENAAAGEYSAPRGELLVTAPVVFGRLHVLPVVSEFLAAFPQITVKLVLADRNLHLLDEHIDVALRIGKLPDSSMIATQVGTVSRVVCASPQYLSRAGEPQSPADLARFSCVVFDALPSGSIWDFASNKGRPESVSIHARLAVNTAEAAIDAAIAGVGLTNVLSYQAASAVSEGKLKLVLRDFEPEPVPVSVMHTGQGRIPLKTRSFIDFTVPRLRVALAHDKSMLSANDPPRERRKAAARGRTTPKPGTSSKASVA